MLRRWIWTFVSGSVLLWGIGLCFSPQDALDYRPPAWTWTEEALGLSRLQQGSATWGLTGWVQADRNKDWSYRGGLGLNLDPVKKTQADLNLARTSAHARARLRAAVYRALELHARMWQAQADVEAALAGVEIAKLDLEASRTRGMGDLELQDAELALQEAQLNLQSAQNRLQLARSEAVLLGLKGPAEPSTLRFALPPARKDPQPGLEQRLRQARRAQSWRGLFGLRTTATYTGRGNYDYRFDFRLQEPRIDASIGPKFPFSQAGNWRFSISLRLNLDPASWARVMQSDLEVREGAETATREQSELQLKLAYWRQQVGLAEERLELAKQRLVLAGKRLEQARLRFERGLISPLDREDVRLRRYQAESRLAAAWAAYLRAVNGYLTTADQDWRKP